MWHQPVALVDDCQRGKLLKRWLRGNSLGPLLPGPGFRRCQGRFKGKHTEKLVEMASQLLYLGIATAEKRLELDDFLVLDTQQLLQLSKGAHRCDRGRSGDVRNGPLAGCSDHGHGAVCRQLWSVLLVGEPLLRRREAQRVEAHAHRHAGVADRHSALGTLVHSTRTKLPREENRSRDENHDPDSASSAASTPRFRALQQRRTNSRDELPRLRLSRSSPMRLALSLFLTPYPHSSDRDR